MLMPLMKVAGIGEGVFILIFFFVIALIITAFAVQSQRPTLYISAAFAVPLILLLLFIGIPKRTPGEDTKRLDYDIGWSTRVGITTIFTIFFILSCFFICIHKVLPKIRAYKIHKYR